MTTLPNVPSPLRLIINRVMPLIYDESLSYTELLAKMLAKINEMIDTINGGDFPELDTLVQEQLNDWRNDGTLLLMINEALAGMLADLAGEGWTNETVKGNADAIAALKGTGWVDETLASLTAALAALAGAGHTTETVKGNADAIAALKGEGYNNETLAGLLDLIDQANTAIEALETAIGQGASLAASLAALAALTPAADQLPYFNGDTTAALVTLSSFIRGLLNDADAAAARATLGMTFGTQVPAIRGTGSATFNPVNYTPGLARYIGDVTVSGAQLGDLVLASCSVDRQGLLIDAYVSAANTVHITGYNRYSDTSIDLPSSTWRVMVIAKP